MFVKHTVFLTVFALAIVQQSDAQDLWSKYRSVPFAQKVWAATHIRHAADMYRISVECRDYAASQLGIYPLDSSSWGGTADAFRHGYWMARLAQQHPLRICLSLGRAYERSNRQAFRQQRRQGQFLYDRASQEMDLRNNRIGADLGLSMRDSSATAVADAVKKMIISGQFYVIAATREGHFMTADGGAVAPCDVPKCWNNGKTLTKSSALAQHPAGGWSLGQ